MARVTRTIYPGERNKAFQPPEEGQSEQRPKRYGDKDVDKSPKNVNNVHNTSSQKYRQILRDSCFYLSKPSD